MQFKVEPFEHLMYADDRPEYPMCFYLRLFLSGRVDRSRFTVAGRKALARHPLFRAHLVGDASAVGSQLHWNVQETSYELPVIWGPVGLLAIDPTRDFGLRVYVEEFANQTKMTFQVHHSASDGAGATLFIEDLLKLYASTADEVPTLRPLDEQLLARRGMFHLTPTESRARLSKDAARVWMYFRQLAQPLAPSATPAGASDAGPVSATGHLAAEDVRQLRANARRLDATFNDLLLRDLFQTLDAWNRKRGGRRHLRLALPINMRLVGDEAMPAANVVSMCFLDRKGSELDDADGLLKGIAAETSFIKSHRMGYALIAVARACARVKGGLKALMTPRWPWVCSSTAVASNLGEPFANAKLPRDVEGRIVSGGLTVERVEFLPPIRPGTALALGVFSYAGSTTLTGHFDPRHLAASDVQAMVDDLIARLADARTLPVPQRVELGTLIEKHAARRLTEPRSALFRSVRTSPRRRPSSFSPSPRWLVRPFRTSAGSNFIDS